MIEPTETEAKAELDGFVDAMAAILAEAKVDATKLRGAPYSQPNRRFDEVRAAREPDLSWRGENR